MVLIPKRMHVRTQGVCHRFRAHGLWARRVITPRVKLAYPLGPRRSQAPESQRVSFQLQRLPVPHPTTVRLRAPPVRRLCVDFKLCGLVPA